MLWIQKFVVYDGIIYTFGVAQRLVKEHVVNASIHILTSCDLFETLS